MFTYTFTKLAYQFTEIYFVYFNAWEETVKLISGSIRVEGFDAPKRRIQKPDQNKKKEKPKPLFTICMIINA